MTQEQIELIILIEVLDFKKPERAGEHCRNLARNAARKILELAPQSSGLARGRQES